MNSPTDKTRNPGTQDTTRTGVRAALLRYAPTLSAPELSARELPVSGLPVSGFSALNLSARGLPERHLPTPGLPTLLLSIALLSGCVTPITDAHRNAATAPPAANTTVAVPTTGSTVKTPAKQVPAGATWPTTARHSQYPQAFSKPRTITSSRELTSPQGVRSLFELARGWVEQETNTNLRHVTLSLTSDRVIQKQVRHETHKLIHGQFDNHHFAERFLNSIVGDQTGGYAALYVSDEKHILVSEPLLGAFVNSVTNDLPLRRNAVLSLLIHELAHAADDIVYGIHENRALSLKSSFTLSATFEGHAQLLTRRICAAQGCLDGMGSLETFMFNAGGSGPVAQGVQAVSRNMLEYSYIEGERFLTQLAKRPNGEQLIHQVMTTPPEDPIQILVPETYPDVSREFRNERLVQALKGARHSWSQYPWKMVETSPIKGINVRHSPERRVAAVEGFTRLIRSMVGAQLYDQTAHTIDPIDLMIIETDGLDTARLFTESFLNQNNRGARIKLTDPRISVSSPYRGYQEFSLTGAAGRETLVGVAGTKVIHITGDARRERLPMMKRYARAILATL